MKTLTEVTIREVADKEEFWLQYISHGKILLEGKHYPISRHGHPDFYPLLQYLTSIFKVDTK